MPALLSLLIALLILAIIVFFAFWLIDMIPAPNPPAEMIKIGLKVVIGLAVLIYLLGILFGGFPRPVLL